MRAIGSRVHAQQSHHPACPTGLLEELAKDPIRQRLVPIEKAARQPHLPPSERWGARFTSSSIPLLSTTACNTTCRRVARLPFSNVHVITVSPPPPCPGKDRYSTMSFLRPCTNLTTSLCSVSGTRNFAKVAAA